MRTLADFGRFDGGVVRDGATIPARCPIRFGSARNWHWKFDDAGTIEAFSPRAIANDQAIARDREAGRCSSLTICAAVIPRSTGGVVRISEDGPATMPLALPAHRAAIASPLARRMERRYGALVMASTSWLADSPSGARNAQRICCGLPEQVTASSPVVPRLAHGSPAGIRFQELLRGSNRSPPEIGCDPGQCVAIPPPSGAFQ